MTQEECIALLKRYAEYDGMGIPNLAGCREAMRMAVELLSKSSLPSNLDEAAEKYSETFEDLQDAIEDAFKAGAEWVAGQGQTFEAHVDNGCAVASGVKLPFVLWNTYEDGDVLKVQIRKKQ